MFVLGTTWRSRLRSFPVIALSAARSHQRRALWISWQLAFRAPP